MVHAVPPSQVCSRDLSTRVNAIGLTFHSALFEAWQRAEVGGGAASAGCACIDDGLAVFVPDGLPSGVDREQVKVCPGGRRVLVRHRAAAPGNAGVEEGMPPQVARDIARPEDEPGGVNG